MTQTSNFIQVNPQGADQHTVSWRAEVNRYSQWVYWQWLCDPNYASSLWVFLGILLLVKGLHPTTPALLFLTSAISAPLNRHHEHVPSTPWCSRSYSHFTKWYHHPLRSCTRKSEWFYNYSVFLIFGINLLTSLTDDAMSKIYLKICHSSLPDPI